MSLFGWKEKKELDVYREVASRDRRTQAQVNDVLKVKNLERLVAALVATILLALIIFL